MADCSTIIFTNNEDPHAFAVDYVLRQLGHSSHIVNTADIPNGQSITIKYGDGDPIIGGNGFTLRLGEVKSSWNRRNSRMFSMPSYAHPADFEYIRTNSAAMVSGFIALLDERFAVNPLSAVRIQSNKLLQLKAAQMSGIRIPRTIVSNNVGDITVFMSEVGSTCVKPYYTYGWKTNDGIRQAITARIDIGEIADPESFKIVPSIYQEYISKKAEYRLTIFGGFHSAVKIDSSSLKGLANVDWRADPSYLAFIIPAALPDNLVNRCRAILKTLGLRFGTFDIGETFDGEFVFFEVNEAGQWLWKELQCPDCKMLQPFCEYLISADDSYTWDNSRWSSEFSADVVTSAILEDERYKNMFGRPSPDQTSHLADERLAAVE